MSAVAARTPPRRRGGRRLLIALVLLIVVAAGGIYWLNLSAQAAVNVSATLAVYQLTRRNEAIRDLQSWVASGTLKVQEDVIQGLENTPKALIGLLAGENRGKRMVKV